MKKIFFLRKMDSIGWGVLQFRNQKEDEDIIVPKDPSDLVLRFGICELEDDTGCVPPDVDHNRRKEMRIPLEYTGPNTFSGQRVPHQHPVSTFSFDKVAEGRGVSMIVTCLNRAAAFQLTTVWKCEMTSAQFRDFRKRRAFEVIGSCPTVPNCKCRGKLLFDVEKDNSISFVSLTFEGLDHFIERLKK